MKYFNKLIYIYTYIYIYNLIKKIIKFIKINFICLINLPFQ